MYPPASQREVMAFVSIRLFPEAPVRTNVRRDEGKVLKTVTGVRRVKSQK